MKSALIVVSHYNAWPTDNLIALLDQIAQVPAGHPFRCRVVVNQAEPKPLELPPRHADVEVLYRENTGYNIGAWNLGWRADPAADFYLFLQEECKILRPDWLKAFVDLLVKPEVGLVGESHFWSGYSWARADYYWRNIRLSRGRDQEGRVPLMIAVRDVLIERQIPFGKNAGHLQSLVLAARRDVLEAIDGFMIGRSYADAIGTEVAISKQVEALGFQVRQVGIGAFRYIIHPQWQHLASGIRPILFRWVEPYLPIRVGAYFHVHPRWHRQVVGRLKQSMATRLLSRTKS